VRDGGRVAPLPLAALNSARLLRPQAGDLPLETAPGGTLIVRVRGKILCRRDGIVARGGELAFTPAMRHTRGRITQEAFAGMFLVTGNGHLIASGRGGAFTAVALAGEALYLREHVVHAFEERLAWENGQVPGSALAVLQLRGDGCVAIHTKRPSIAIEIRERRPLAVAPDALIGWSGKVVPRLVTEAGAPRVECAGDGVVLVEEPSGWRRNTAPCATRSPISPPCSRSGASPPCRSSSRSSTITAARCPSPRRSSSCWAGSPTSSTVGSRAGAGRSRSWARSSTRSPTSCSSW